MGTSGYCVLQGLEIAVTKIYFINSLPAVEARILRALNLA
jgi:hypothetical protein